jgi:hypothetical protein
MAAATANQDTMYVLILTRLHASSFFWRGVSFFWKRNGTHVLMEGLVSAAQQSSYGGWGNYGGGAGGYSSGGYGQGI